MRTFLIRHPKPDIDAGICYGHSDVGLAESPFERAAALSPLLPVEAPLYSSPLRRCLELARVLHPQPAIDARLVEMNFGDWELRRWDDIPRTEMEAWAADPVGYAPPGGESAAALRDRVALLLRDLPEVAVLVAHGGVLRACMAELVGTANWHEQHFDYGSVSLIENGRLLWQNRRDAD